MEDYVCWIVPIIIVLVIIVMMYIPEKKREKNKNSLLSQLKQDKFKADKTYNISLMDDSKQVLFDLDNNKIAILDVLANTLDYIEINKIIDCEIIQDNATIMKGGIGRAIVGGVLAGGVGAIVGAGTRGSSDVIKNLAVRIITNDISKPLVMITLIDGEVKRDSHVYKKHMASAQEIYSAIISIINSSKTDVHLTTDSLISKSAPDEIRELAKLKEEGLLTEDEFNKKKKALLNID